MCLPLFYFSHIATNAFIAREAKFFGGLEIGMNAGPCMKNCQNITPRYCIQSIGCFGHLDTGLNGQITSLPTNHKEIDMWISSIICALIGVILAIAGLSVLRNWEAVAIIVLVALNGMAGTYWPK